MTSKLNFFHLPRWRLTIDHKRINIILTSQCHQSHNSDPFTFKMGFYILIIYFPSESLIRGKEWARRKRNIRAVCYFWIQGKCCEEYDTKSFYRS